MELNATFTSTSANAYMAQKWLNHFCEKGIMVKEGALGVFLLNE